MRVLLSSIVCIGLDIGSVSVFTVQIDDTSDETNVSATASVKSGGHGHIGHLADDLGPLKQKSQGAQAAPPPVPTPMRT